MTVSAIKYGVLFRRDVKATFFVFFMLTMACEMPIKEAHSKENKVHSLVPGMEV